ncbi:MAG: hypothetical protein IJP28_05690, partial [Erysipelotrichales bacterium]|nr:hypothetical protein [Erysipelotrichales bacterium]
MKKRFDYFLETTQFPLVVLFIATFLLGCGNLLVNSQVAIFWSNTNTFIQLLSAYLRLAGSFLIQIFPLIILVYATQKKMDDPVAGVLGAVTYFFLLITTMFLAPTSLPSYAYTKIFGLSIDSSLFSVLGAQSRSPLNLGVLASVICYYIVKYCYLRTRNRRAYGIFAFVDKNMLAVIWCTCVSIVVGGILSFVWPYVIKGVVAVFAFIADDITNPFNLFIYGITERFASMLNMVEIPRGVFWFGESGGSWLDSLGRKFVGDVSIWTAQISNSAVSSGIGRFITPLYVIQIFAIPGYLVAMFTLYTNRFEKRKYLVFLIFAILISMFMGSSAPFDLFMFCTAPLLFMLHVFFCGVLYAALQWSKVY